MKLMDVTSAGKFVGNHLEQNGHMSDEHANSKGLRASSSGCNTEMARARSRNFLKGAQTSLVKLMGITSAGKFVGNPLEQKGHSDEHANSERLES